MRKPVIAGGIALCAGIIVGTQLLMPSKRVSAQTVAVSMLTSSSVVDEAIKQEKTVETDVVQTAVNTIIATSEKSTISDKSEELEPVVHVVDSGESLEKIAELYNVTDWKRLYDKNTAIEHPDILHVGQEIIIPSDDEELESRELHVFIAPEPVEYSQSTTSTAQPSSSAQPVSQARPSSASGNKYSYGYCTWYVKNMRPDLPNNLGSANTWYSRAAAQGFSVGYSPRVGAAAEALTGYMHVAYVTAVHGDGTITISEMNYKGWGVVNSRRVSSAEFRYIY